MIRAVLDWLETYGSVFVVGSDSVFVVGSDVEFVVGSGSVLVVGSDVEFVVGSGVLRSEFCNIVSSLLSQSERPPIIELCVSLISLF